MNSHRIHPAEALRGAEKPLPIIPACEHVAGRPRYVEKGLELHREFSGAFDLTCDLEDGSAAGAEIEHLHRIVSLIKQSAHAHRIGIRVHPFDSPFWQSEIEHCLNQLGPQIRYFNLPKVFGPEEVSAVSEFINRSTERLGIPAVPLHLMIETQHALRRIWDLTALPGIETVDFGIMDFISAHGGAIPGTAMRSPGQFSHHLLVRAKGEICAAALANGVVPNHNVTVDYQSTDQVYADALVAREEFGFLRMWSIHPAQIQPIIDAFTPAAADLAEAETVLLKAWNSDWGPLEHDGRLHDRASFRYYWDLLCRARANGAKLQPETEAAFFRTEV